MGCLAQGIQLVEAAKDLSAQDVQARLRSAIQEKHSGTSDYGYYENHFGDDNAGDVVYTKNGKMLQAPYTMAGGKGAKKAAIDFDKAGQVIPRTVYDKHVKESIRADSSNTSPATVVTEAAAGQGDVIELTECATEVDVISLSEAAGKSDYEIKIIGPGKGATAWYTPEVLKRDAGVFKPNCHVYMNHATKMEEAARPEGDVNKLAGVLTTAGEYKEAHAKGPGVYARMKVFADHATAVGEKAPYVGMSIRALGIAESGGVKRDGVPVLKQLTAVESVDVVTKAGAGGMILQESAAGTAATGETSTMNEEEIKLLRETVAKQATTTAFLMDQEHRRIAITEGAKVLIGISLPAASKEYVIGKVMERALPKQADGSLDLVKLTEAVQQEAKSFGAAMGIDLSKVVGMGGGTGATTPAEVALTEAQKVATVDAQKADQKRLTEAWSELFADSGRGDPTKLAEVALKGKVA